LAIVYVFVIAKWNQPLMIRIGCVMVAMYLGVKRRKSICATRPLSGRSAGARLSDALDLI